MAQPTHQTIAAAKRAAELAADVAAALVRGGPAADYIEEPESAYLLRIGSAGDARRKLAQVADALDALHAELAGRDPNGDYPTDEEVKREREARLDVEAAERVGRFLREWYGPTGHAGVAMINDVDRDDSLQADDVARLARAVLA